MKGLFKVLTIAAVICASSLDSIAQNARYSFDVFNKSFIKNISYPVALIDQCLPTVAVIKIDIGKYGNLEKMQLSDSADTLFKKEFTTKKNTF